MGTAVKTTPEQRVRKARQVATKAINHAATETASQQPTRSTASRRGLKIKADALDQVARILSGQE